MKPTKAKKVYKNPIYTALEWQEMLDKEQFKSKADLARYLGVSRVRVVQMLNLLKLDKEVLKTLCRLGGNL